MGFWSRLFNDDSGDTTVRVRQSNENNARIRGDTYKHGGGKEHTHRSFDLDTASGSYKEYGGGEKSQDRGYNK